jgi:hypothetical protein
MGMGDSGDRKGTKAEAVALVELLEADLGTNGIVAEASFEF